MKSRPKSPASTAVLELGASGALDDEADMDLDQPDRADHDRDQRKRDVPGEQTDDQQQATDAFCDHLKSCHDFGRGYVARVQEPGVLLDTAVELEPSAPRENHPDTESQEQRAKWSAQPLGEDSTVCMGSPGTCVARCPDNITIPGFPIVDNPQPTRTIGGPPPPWPVPVDLGMAGAAQGAPGRLMSGP